MNVIPRQVWVAIAAAVAFLIFSAAYTVSETEQVIITQFGKPVGEPITTAGLHSKCRSSKK